MIVVEATRYTVCAVPLGYPEADLYSVHVERTGWGDVSHQGALSPLWCWAVRRGAYCLSRSNEWVYEPQSSSRTDEWLSDHRWTLEEALAEARKEAPNLKINGMTPRMYVLHMAERAMANP